MNKPVIEGCYQLPISALKRLLEPLVGSKEGLTKAKHFTLKCGQNQTADYWVEKEENEVFLMIVCGDNEPQRISLTTSYPPFGGTRYYFECPDCVRRCDKLYLSPYGQGFKCHKHFIYEANTINRQSVHGQYVYQQSRLIKLINHRTDISRIWYRDTYTKRFCRFLKMSARAGLTQNVEEALALLGEINAAKRPLST